MLATGDFIEPRNLDEPRWKKPIGIYWLQSAAAALSGQGAEAPLWVWRLPSALGILAAALLTLWAVRPLVGPGAAASRGSSSRPRS
jgi:4-amino-4-deoxy-L-arabinose transferase-like glycosyltransferase